MKVFLLSAVLLSASTSLAWAQTYKGRVVDSGGHAMEQVSVIGMGEKDTPVGFSRTDRGGLFELKISDGKHVSTIVFSLLGYEKTAVATSEFRNGQTVKLQEKEYRIREVKVSSQRLRRNNDTLTYSVAGFRQKQDRTIADVIAKMPGLEVKQDGTIAYQGRSINKFYIEGMDLLGSKYAQASQNISADKVTSVQVLQNHQPVKTLQNIKFSDQAAMNIVLKDDAKNVWNGVADVNTGMTLQGGCEWLRDFRIVEMLFSRRMQSISMYKCNNTGKDILFEVGDLANTGRGLTPENGILSQFAQSAPSLDEERYRLNDSHLFATNWLLKTTKDNDLRIQIHALFDKTRNRQYSETYYTDVADRMLITEDYHAKNTTDEWDGEVLYQVNKDRVYINNNARGYIDFDKSDGQTALNGKTVRQDVEPRKRYFSDDFELIRKVGGDRSLSLSSQLICNYLPGNLLLTDSTREHLALHALTWDTYTYFSHKVLGLYLTYKAGFKVHAQHLDIRNDETSSADSYHEYRWYVSPAVNYRCGDLHISAAMPATLLYRKYNLARHTTRIFEPSVLLRYELSALLSASAAYSHQFNPADISTMEASPIYVDYINVTSGTGILDHTSNHHISFAMEYSNPIRGFFASCSLFYNNLKNNILYKSILQNGIYRRAATDAHSDNHIYGVRARVSKAISWAKTSMALSGSYTWNDYHLLLSDVITPYRMCTANLEFTLSMRPAQLLSIEETSSVLYNRQRNKDNPSLSSPSLTSFYHKLKTFLFLGRWQVEWDNECYHSNDKSVSFNFFSDMSISYRTHEYEIGIVCNNLLGTTSYERKFVSGNQQLYTLNRLRVREALAKFSFNL